jgi:hypothetical protein
MVFSGSLATINAALNNLTYRGLQDFAGSDTISIAANDQGNTGSGGALSDSKGIAVSVSAVNDAPVLSVPGALLALRDTDSTVSTITISDVDVTSGIMIFTATATNGTLRLASTAGLSSIAGNNTSNLQFSGTLAALNAALNNNLIYRGNASYSGPDTIVCTVDDQGHTGSGGAKSDTKSISVTVDVSVGVSGLHVE